MSKIGAYSVRFPCPRIARCKDMSPWFLKLNQLNAGLPLSAITLNDKTISHMPNKSFDNPNTDEISNFYFNPIIIHLAGVRRRDRIRFIKKYKKIFL